MNTRRRIYVLAGVIIIFGVLFMLSPWLDFSLQNIDKKVEMVKLWSGKFGPWAPLAYLLGFTLRPLVFFPASIFAVLGGVLFGSAFGTVYVLIGAMCSGVCEFIIARYFLGNRARLFMERHSRVVIPIMAKHGFMTVFLVRIIPNVAFDLQNFGLAFTPVRFWHFFWGTLFGCLPACVFYASLGDAALNWSAPSKIGLAVSIGACLLILRALIKFVRARQHYQTVPEANTDMNKKRTA